MGMLVNMSICVNAYVYEYICVHLYMCMNMTSFMSIRMCRYCVCMYSTVVSN